MSAVLLTLLIGIVVGIVVAEVKGGLTDLARAIARIAAKRLPPPHDERYAEEFAADLERWADRPLTMLWHAAGMYRRTGEMRAVLQPRATHSRTARLLKRLVDLTTATAGLVALAPLLLVVAVCVKLESRGPILYRQARRGLHGRPFHVYKFRTLCQAAEERTSEVISPKELSVSEPMFKVSNDPRVTRVGRFLRRYSLDELPQLINVVRGDMSLVGPRPMPEDLATLLDADVPDRPDIAPGLVAPSLLVAPDRQKSVFEMLALDDEYARHWSLWTDIKILLRTISYMLRGR